MRRTIDKTKTCRHYQGTCNATCAAGVNLRQHVGGPDEGWAIRLPCNDYLRQSNVERGSLPTVECEKFSPLTKAEIDAEEAEFEAAMERIRKVSPLVSRIKKENRGKSVTKTDPCPVCGKTLHWSHAAYNGHVHMRCETDGCIAFME